MQKIQELYKLGKGPSSSHTLAPERACKLFESVFGECDHYRVELYGSLSLTGKGHRTDAVIEETLHHRVDVTFHLEWQEEFPNGFYLFGYDAQDQCIAKWTVFSIGGGSIQIKEYPLDFNDEVYEENQFKTIKQVLNEKQIDLITYIESHEPNLRAYLETILDGQLACVKAGLETEGQLPGRLKLKRIAKQLYQQGVSLGDSGVNIRLMAYAYSANEQNADNQACVTAPTLGACGVMSALMYYCAIEKKFPRHLLIEGLMIGGLFGNLIKHNATISGAMGGCQAEVGAAVAMAAGAYAYMMGGDLNEIEYAAEIGIEHHLGLTCDPVMGYVMIPCLERNAMGILRAIDGATLAASMSKIRQHMVSFDTVVETMNETGKCIPTSLKETSIGGLAKYFDESQC